MLLIEIVHAMLAFNHVQGQANEYESTGLLQTGLKQPEAEIKGVNLSV